MSVSVMFSHSMLGQSRKIHKKRKRIFPLPLDALERWTDGFATAYAESGGMPARHLAEPINGVYYIEMRRNFLGSIK